LGGDSANFPSDTGIAIITCTSGCGIGDSFSLDHFAHVPLGDPSGFGGVFYAVHLEGMVDAPQPAIRIDIEKLTNGNQADGANDPDVPIIAQGEIVSWVYKVTNTGDFDLSEPEIVVTDSQPGIVPALDTGSDAGGDMILSTGESWNYTATAQALDLEAPPAGITVVPGCGNNRNTYENTGWVWVANTAVLDNDLSHYCNPVLDSDNDGVPDFQDNCILKPNGPLIPDAGGNSQRDTDGDGYGNVCDADLNNFGDVVNLSDYSVFRGFFGAPEPLNQQAVHADFNGDGRVNLSDYSIFRASFGKAPGPSCCGL
jgi:hypothetical protein